MVLRDPALPHQVVIGTSGDGWHNITVSCNCRGKRNHNGTVTYEPMGITNNYRETLVMYNDPDNHRVNQGVPFDHTLFLRLPQP